MVNRDPLLIHLVEDYRAHHMQMRGDGIPGKRIQEIQSLVRYIVDGFDEEVSGAHCGVEYLEVEKFVDELAPAILDGGSGFILSGLFAFCFCRLYRVAVPSLSFA